MNYVWGFQQDPLNESIEDIYDCLCRIPLHLIIHDKDSRTKIIGTGAFIFAVVTSVSK
jgi:hypothetical protein